MIRFYFILLLLIGISTQVFAQSVSYPLDASHSVISFSVGFAGGVSSIDGRFDDFDGTIGYKNVNDPNSLFVNAVISVKSINTGDKNRDKDLQGAGYFDSENFPEITFKSDKVMKTKDGLMVSGVFTMMGKTSNIQMPFSIHKPPIVWVFGEPRIAMKGSHTINRLDYGIPNQGWDNIIPSLGSMSLSKEVNIRMVVQGVGPSLSTLVLEKISEENVSLAIKLYNDLEANEADNGTYTFGVRTILGVVMQLSRGGKNVEAIEMGEFGTLKYGDSFMSWYGLAIAHEGAGNKKKAMEFYSKTLELNPKFSRAQSALNMLNK